MAEYLTNYLKELTQLKIGVIGLGVSGYACAEFLLERNIEPFLVDGNISSINAQRCQKAWPNVAIYDLANCQCELNNADLLIVSPGIALSTQALVTAKQQGVEIIGDVELFARLNSTPVIAITGSNGKSSVTTLTTLMLQKAGFKAAYGGNIGVPVMQLLAQDNQFDVLVLELSSFQLETTDSLNCHSATILNVVEDHMDRYDDFASYAMTKQKIYRHCQLAVVNRADDNTLLSASSGLLMSFGLDKPAGSAVGIDAGMLVNNVNGERVPLCKVSELKLQGQHNELNALAAWALTLPFAPENSAIVAALKEFDGLPHRCQLVTCFDDGIEWINDSKGTNVGATVAAINSIRPRVVGRMALIAGGDGKQADFSPLQQVMNVHVDYLITLGEDGAAIDAHFGGEKVAVSDLGEAVKHAKHWAKVNDCVVFSPACASGKSFSNYIERGEIFTKLVQDVQVQGGANGH